MNSCRTVPLVLLMFLACRSTRPPAHGGGDMGGTGASQEPRPSADAAGGSAAPQPAPLDAGAKDSAGATADGPGGAADGSSDGSGSPPAPRRFRFVEASDSHLPPGTRSTETMAVRFADVDGDGDLDVVLACEFQRNRLLLNDGRGRLTDVTEASLPDHRRDTEDLAIADFDGDGRPDLVFATEDGQTNDLYLNRGGALFMEKTGFPAGGTTNAVVTLDLDGDGDWDLILGNRGQNIVLVNDGQGNFTDETAARLPPDAAITQDLELGDVDGDGDLDLIVGNEGRNRLLLHSGNGVFVDVTEERLPSQAPHDETRGVYVGDVDGDGDLDIFFANAARTGGRSRQNRLLINDGRGFFSDETAMRLPPDDEEAMGGRLVDLDGDGALDIVVASYRGRQGPASPYIVFKNDGKGFFEAATDELFPAGVTGHGFDVEAGDLNGDGHVDLYLASGRSRDRLLLSQPE